MLHEYAISSMQDTTSPTVIVANPLLNAYIEAQTDGSKTLKKKLKVIQTLIRNAKTIER